jgi:hypothetical protein
MIFHKVQKRMDDTVSNEELIEALTTRHLLLPEHKELIPQRSFSGTSSQPIISSSSPDWSSNGFYYSTGTASSSSASPLVPVTSPPSMSLHLDEAVSLKEMLDGAVGDIKPLPDDGITLESLGLSGDCCELGM